MSNIVARFDIKRVSRSQLITNIVTRIDIQGSQWMSVLVTTFEFIQTLRVIWNSNLGTWNEFSWDFETYLMSIIVTKIEINLTVALFCISGFKGESSYLHLSSVFLYVCLFVCLLPKVLPQYLSQNKSNLHKTFRINLSWSAKMIYTSKWENT